MQKTPITLHLRTSVFNTKEISMKKVVTPLHHFHNLPDYPFAFNYVSVGDAMTMHYVDEGPKDGEIVLLLHGEPSWS